jgi:hypothetical protein
MRNLGVTMTDGRRLYDQEVLAQVRAEQLREESVSDCLDYAMRVARWVRESQTYRTTERERSCLERARINAQDMLGLLDELLDGDPRTTVEAIETTPTRRALLVEEP